MTALLINLDDCRTVADVRDRILQADDDDGPTIIVIDGRPRGAYVGFDAVKETLWRRVLKRWSARPQALLDVLDRINREKPKDFSP
ncbi:MAG: hypothetical protein BGO49_05655 [Planctomycetales bacterium 71-10]|nr:MAG: hypothetical protein BGO49_05655 [Planctomycetales bacterium 71-10]